MSQNDLVETLWTLAPGEFSESDFIDVYRKRFTEKNVPSDQHIEAALASLYLQKLVRNNVLTYARGRYLKQQRTNVAEA